MTVRISSKQEFQSSVTPSALNTETDLINLGTFSDTIIFEGYIDTSQMRSGDTATFNIYVAIDGTNRVLLDTVTVSGPLNPPVIHVLSSTLPKNARPRVTVNQTAGTLRKFSYYFIVEILETI